MTVKTSSIYTKQGQLTCPADDHASWCDHIKALIMSGKDAEGLGPDQQVIVPIFPISGIFADVRINEAISNGSAIMKLHFAPDMGRPYTVNLGFWNRGEGRASIRLVIIDYMMSKVSPKESLLNTTIVTPCNSGIHGVRESRLVAQALAEDSTWKMKYLWNVVMEKACPICIEISGTDSDFGLSGV